MSLSDFFRKKNKEKFNNSLVIKNIEESNHLLSMANDFFVRGDLDSAESQYRESIKLNDENIDSLFYLAVLLTQKGVLLEAKNNLKKVLEIREFHLEALDVLSSIYEGEGDFVSSLKCIDKILSANEKFEEAYLAKCRILFQLGNLDDAQIIIENGLRQNNNNPDFHYYLGNVYFYKKQFNSAINSYKKALELNPNLSGAYLNLANSLFEVDNFEEGIKFYEEAQLLESDIDKIKSYTNLLFAMNYKNDFSYEKYYEKALEYNNLLTRNIKPYEVWEKNKSGKIRIGFVSGDLRKHPVGFFIESIFNDINKEKFNLIVYSTSEFEDEITSKIKSCCVEWNMVGNLLDHKIAEKIYNDKIDILIDLSGHTLNNRLSIFAYKPASIQVTWLGYFASTGLKTIDYILSDEYSIQKEEECYFTEKVFYLPNTRLCFTKPSTENQIYPLALPMNNSENIIFGCYQNLNKINDDLLLVWKEILNNIPNAKIRIQSKQLSVEKQKNDFIENLNKLGLDKDRFLLFGLIPREDYFNSHAEVDFILDTFPYNGGTTTCEALWMGVPTLTLEGNTIIGRQSASILKCVELNDWIAKSKEEYVKKAIELSNKKDLLNELRSSLREKVEKSPLMDSKLFAKNLENAFEKMLNNK